MSSPLVSKTPEQLKVAELREELKKRGITSKGLKKDLVERLEEALREEAAKAKELEANALVTKSFELNQLPEEALVEFGHAGVAIESLKADEPHTPSVPLPEEAVIESVHATSFEESLNQASVQSAELLEPVLEVGTDRDATIVEETVAESTVTSTVTSVERHEQLEPMLEAQTTVMEETVVVESALTSVERHEPIVEGEAHQDATVFEETIVEEKVEERMEEIKLEAKAAEYHIKEEALKERPDINVGAAETLLQDEQVKDEPMEAKEEAGSDKEHVEKPEDITETNHLEAFAEGKEPLVEGQENDESEGTEEGNGEVRAPEGIEKVSDTKPMDLDSEAQAGLKRKEYGEGQQADQSKRQRRWNSGKNLSAESDLKPKVSSDLTPVVNVGLNVAGSNSFSNRPLADRTAVSRPVVSTPGSDLPSNGRNVPPSTKTPTTSLRIDRFVRPFTLKALKDLLAETGTFSDFWMDQIKTHCYVTYSSVEEAEATREALYNLKWPVVGGKQLIAEFVEPEEVKQKCEGGNEKPPASNMTVTVPRGTGGSALPSPHTPVSPYAPPSMPLHREKPTLLTKREPEPIVTLDDLFKKTSAKPNIYYLPLTEAQVAAKVATKT